MLMMSPGTGKEPVLELPTPTDANSGCVEASVTKLPPTRLDEKIGFFPYTTERKRSASSVH
jgi:hypothetical protein